MQLEQAASDFRARALRLIDPDAQGLPETPHTAFLWPTQLCSINCAHCSFGARKSGGAELRQLADRPTQVVDWLADAGAARMVICGGGEPLDEPEFVTNALSGAVRKGLRTEIYTAGVSLSRPVDVRGTIRDWLDALDGNCFHLRLSVDQFHAERVGLDRVTEWIRETGQLAPHWKVSLRGIRVIGDTTIEQIAELLAADVQSRRPHVGKLVLPDGRSIAFERKAFVLDNRGTLSLLARRGLSLPDEEIEHLTAMLEPEALKNPIGRPFSAPLTVGFRRMDLEIHANGVVNILESQAPDLRKTLFAADWASMRSEYYRDPIMHLVALQGLQAVAGLIAQGQRHISVSGKVVPYSVQRLEDPGLRGWVTAQAILSCSSEFVYPTDLRREANALCSVVTASV